MIVSVFYKDGAYGDRTVELWESIEIWNKWGAIDLSVNELQTLKLYKLGSEIKL